MKTLLLFLLLSLQTFAQSGSPAAPAAGVRQTATYRHHGNALLPDPAVTPGAVGPMTAAQLCDPSFHTGTVRAVSESLKKQVCAAYAPGKPCDKTIEIDHLVSLELGGTNDVANLWRQPYAPVPGAHQKDLVENWLHRQVCAGNWTLAAAQAAIRKDWYAVYLQMPPAEQKKAAKQR